MNKIQAQDIQKNKTAKIELSNGFIIFTTVLWSIGKIIISILII
jgi:hypothetical protein